MILEQRNLGLKDAKELVEATMAEENYNGAPKIHLIKMLRVQHTNAFDLGYELGRNNAPTRETPSLTGLYSAMSRLKHLEDYFMDARCEHTRDTDKIHSLAMSDMCKLAAHEISLVLAKLEG